MADVILATLRDKLGAAILETSAFRGDECARVDASQWVPVATFLRDELEMNHFTDLTAVDYPSRKDLRFDVILHVRSMKTGARIRLKTRLAEGASIATVVPIWAGANWAEREVYDMFGIRFEGHPDLRRILMYDEFVGHPLRKDYPIEKTQPLVPYRDVQGIDKIAPFGADMGQPFSRVDWNARLEGREHQVSPAIALQAGEKRSLSDSEAAVQQAKKG